MKRDHAVWGVFLLATLLRLPGLASQGLWDDEGYAYLWSIMPCFDLIQSVSRYDFSPPLGYLLNKIPLLFYPDQTWSIRLPALAGSLATIFLIYRWCRQEISARVALIAAVLISISPNAIFFAQQGRAYAITALCYTGIILFTLSYRKSGRLGDLGWLCLCELAALYLHNTSVLLCLTASLLYWLPGRKSSRSGRNWLIAHGGVLLCYLPWLPHLLDQLQRTRKAPFFAFYWSGLNWFTATFDSLRALTPGDRAPSGKLPVPALSLMSWLPSLLALTIAALMRPWRIFQDWLKILIAILLPILTMAVLSQLGTPTYAIGRIESLFVPLFCILLAMALDKLPSKKAVWMGVLFFAVAGLIPAVKYLSPTNDSRKKWDDLLVAGLYFKDQPDLVILDMKVRASVPAHLYARNHLQNDTGSAVLVYPDPTGEMDPANLPKRFVTLRTLTELNRETLSNAMVESAQTRLRSYLQEKRPKQISLVYPATFNTEKELLRESYLDGLLLELQNQGCRLRRKPTVFEMDWHTVGFHVSTSLDCF